MTRSAGSRYINLYNRYIQLSFRPSFYDTAAVNKLRLNLTDHYFKTRQLLHYLPPFTEPVNLFPPLESVRVPALIIRSELDALPPEADRRLERTLPEARLVTIAKAGHFPFIEQPQAVIQLLAGFIGNHAR